MQRETERANKHEAKAKELTKQLQSKQRKEDKQIAAKKAEETLREEKEKAVEARFKREAEEKVKAVHLEWEAKYQKLEAESLSIKREKEKLQKGLKKKLNSIRRDKDKIAEREKVQEDRERRLNILMGQQDALAGCSLAELKEWEAILEVSQRKVGEAKIKAEVAQRLAGTTHPSSLAHTPSLTNTLHLHTDTEKEKLEQERARKECVICCDKQKAVVFVPCGKYYCSMLPCSIRELRLSHRPPCVL